MALLVCAAAGAGISAALFFNLREQAGPTAAWLGALVTSQAATAACVLAKRALLDCWWVLAAGTSWPFLCDWGMRPLLAWEALALHLLPALLGALLAPAVSGVADLCLRVAPCVQLQYLAFLRRVALVLTASLLAGYAGGALWWLAGLAPCPGPASSPLPFVPPAHSLPSVWVGLAARGRQPAAPGPPLHL